MKVRFMTRGKCNGLSRKIIVEDWYAVYAGQEIDVKLKINARQRRSVEGMK